MEVAVAGGAGIAEGESAMGSPARGSGKAGRAPTELNTEMHQRRGRTKTPCSPGKILNVLSCADHEQKKKGPTR